MVESMWGRFSAIAVLFVCLTVTLTGGSPSAWAACTSPSKAAGDIVYNASEKTFQYCSDTVWKAMNLPGSGSGGCTNPARAEGEIIYNADHRVMQGCAGNVWRAIGDGGADEWVQMSVGLDHSCGIKNDQTLWCWGYNYQGQLGDGTTTTRALPVQVEPGALWAHVAAGGDVTCALKTNGTAWCWGENGQGQLGDGTNNPSLVPVAVTGGHTWKSLSAGMWHVCGIKSDDTIRCWGSGWAAQIGDGSGNNFNVPTAVSGGGTWKLVEAGGYNNCAIRTDDTMRCWGANWYGEVGDGTTTNRYTPVTVSGGGTWKRVSVGDSHTCGIRADDTMRCWGANTEGAVGDNTQTDKSAPTAVSGGGTWLAVTAGSGFSCGVKSDNSVWCWGTNYSGQLGDGTTAYKLVPTAYSAGGSWKDIAAGISFVCGHKTDNQLQCWGANYSGQLGDGTSSTVTEPMAIDDKGPWKQYSGGMQHSCAIKMDGTLWCWGPKSEMWSAGWLGTNSMDAEPLPVQVFGGGTWNRVSSGNNHTCAIKGDGSLWCWGEGYAIGDGTGNMSLAPVEVDSGVWTYLDATGYHSCGIKSDGSAWCWGSGGIALGDNGVGDGLTPVEVQGGSTWKSIAVGDGATCGIKTDNTLWCWGSNSLGQLGDGTNNDSSVPVEVSGGGQWSHISMGTNVSGPGGGSCGIKTNGTMWCWGGNGGGMQGNGTYTDSTVPVEVSGGSSWKYAETTEAGTCGIKSDDSLWCWGSGNDLGLGDLTTTAVPMEIKGRGSWKNVGRGSVFTCAISNGKGELFCWGDNGGNQAGALTVTEKSSPIRTSGRTMGCSNPEGRPGKMIYNEAEKAMQYCNGVGWIGVNYNPPPPSYIPTSNLLAYWAFDETAGTTLPDLSGNNHTGTLQNMNPATDWVAGKVGNALDFDGTDDYVSYANDIPFAYDVFTIAGWFYVRGTGGGDDEFPVFMQRDFDTGNGQSTVGIVVRNSNKKVHTQIRDDVDAVIQCIGSTTIVWNNWYHFTVVKTSSNMKLYINGVQDCSTSFSRWGSFSANIARREIGRHTNSSGTGGLANGRIDELRVYNRILTTTEIQALAAQ